MDGAKILIVEDDKNISTIVKMYLEKEGYSVSSAYDGESGIRQFEREGCDLAVLDIMLPKMSGYEVCRRIREKGGVPVIMLTARGDTADKVAGLEIGADDYIVKPFEMKELLARIKAVLRRSSPQEAKPHSMVFGDMKIDLASYTVSIGKLSMELPPKEMELLSFLAGNKNTVFTREQLLEKVWGYNYFGDSRTVDVHIKRLREKLPQDSSHWQLKTVWGVGYKFEVK
ncbi:MAG: response regulator transcription factor [Bacillota bacterium]|nr:response regulator transcription factor [Bacillota bacterium]